EAILTISAGNLTHAITPELPNDAKSRKWVRLPYALRYVDLFCARPRREQRMSGDIVVVVIVLMLALLFRLLHMCAALEVNFVSKQLAIYLSVMAADIQRPL